ncbi:MAG: 1-acyl-sn-glycerol-3-phosphate acyltransferase [Thermoplasmatota archaeon]
MLEWLWWTLAAIVLYEFLRNAVVKSVRYVYEERVDEFLRRNEIPTDSFRHTHRVVVKEMVLGDVRLAEAIAERAQQDGESAENVRNQVRDWLDEILPRFNLLAYYQVGYALGRVAAYSTYNVRLDKSSLAAAKARIPEDSSVVYVSNHRSNADFVITGFMLSKSVQISYAVGEWARVWPLEGLFKSFGSYFVRRGEKDPLYHQTLEAYLQLITKQKVTQAMFPEGGLSRDGGLRPVKLGLLDYMAKAKLDPAFKAPLVFVPVGINFDRVIEDENMVLEARGEAPMHRRSPWQKTKRAVALFGKVVLIWPLNVLRFMAKRLKKHGVAAIHFGEPISFDDWYAGQSFLEEPDRKARQAALRPFGEQLMERIEKVIPVTPVTLACHAAARLGEGQMTAGVPVATFKTEMLASLQSLQDRPWELEAYDGDATSAVGVEDDIELAAVVDRAFELAMDVTERRGVLVGGDEVVSRRFDLVQYYANSLN